MRRSAAALLLLLVACASAGARTRHRGTTKLNMPPGWSWPPSAEMLGDGALCLKRLGDLGVEFTPAPKTPKVTTPIYVTGMEIGGVKLTAMWEKGPFVMDCFLALALAERGSAILRGAGVAELRFGGIHAVRNIAGTHILSRHALGLAMDVFAIVTDDGIEHVVVDDYKRGDAVLLSVEKWIDDSGVFRTVLTPGNDPKRHHDHFHFEAMTFADRRKLKLIS